MARWLALLAWVAAVPLPAMAGANCAQSNSWQCQHRVPAPGGGVTSGTSPSQVVAPHTAPVGTTTPALGSLVGASSNKVTLTAKKAAQPALITVTGTQNTVTGFGPVPAVQGVPGPGFTGTGTPPATPIMSR